MLTSNDNKIIKSNTSDSDNKTINSKCNDAQIYSLSALFLYHNYSFTYLFIFASVEGQVCRCHQRAIISTTIIINAMKKYVQMGAERSLEGENMLLETLEE